MPSLYQKPSNQGDIEDTLIDYIQDLDMPKLDTDESNALEQEITNEEVKMAIKEMDADKVSGIDGLPIEFYRMFYSKLENFFIKSNERGCPRWPVM